MRKEGRVELGNGQVAEDTGYKREARENEAALDAIMVRLTCRLGCCCERYLLPDAY